ncbi:MAG: prolipoprotein diacylglyceryl transferase, partial [Duncaniella sp.]|nr:prolipoprotein diacylglyceryl transferase [Duncaniella sp.]
MLDFITWTADPVWFHIGPVAIRWYSLAFMVGFLVGYEIEARIYRHEGAPERWLG